MYLNQNQSSSKSTALTGCLSGMIDFLCTSRGMALRISVQHMAMVCILHYNVWTRTIRIFCASVIAQHSAIYRISKL